MIEIIYTNSIKEISINNKTFSLFEYIDTLSVEETSFSFIQNLERQMVDGKTIEDLYTYDGIPLYFFVRPTLYGKLKNIIFFVELLEKIIIDKKNNYFIKTDNEILNKVANDIFKINCETISNDNITDNSFDFKTYFNTTNRYINGATSLLKFLLKPKKERILAITHSADINFVNNENFKGYSDTQLGAVISKLKNKFNVLEFQLLNNKNQVAKSNKYKNNFIPFEFFVIYKKIIKKKAIDNIKIQYYKDNYKYLNFHYKNYDLKSIILDIVFNNFESECNNYLLEILAAEKFISKFKFEKVLVAGEGDRGRCFVVASHRAGVPCYAVQHGIINETSPNYIIKSKSNINLTPSLFFVWGKKYQEILFKNTNIYNAHNTSIVGQVRTDLLKQYNVKTDKPHNAVRILYATQYLKDLLEPATEMLFKAINLLKEDYELVIKLHPADTYLEFYNQLIKTYNIKKVKIVKDEDLYNLISWSDIIVSVHSTVVLEGALMEKPSVCLILPKYNDEGGFIKDGISLGANNEYELINCITNYGNDYIHKMKTYIDNNFYKVDGKVTKRIIEKIIT